MRKGLFKRINESEAQLRTGKLYDDDIWKLYKVNTYEACRDLLQSLRIVPRGGITKIQDLRNDVIYEMFASYKSQNAVKEYFTKKYAESSDYIILEYQDDLVLNFYSIHFLKKRILAYGNSMKEIGYRELKSVPKELLEKVVNDNHESILAGASMLDIRTLIGPRASNLDNAYTKRVVDPSEIGIWKNLNGFIVAKDGTLIRYPADATHLEEFVYPEGITCIPYIEDFKPNFSYQRVVFPSTLKVIGNSAFRGMKKLFTGEIELPEGLEEIGDSAFRFSSITGRLVFPSTLKKLGISAFEQANGIEEVDLSKTQIETIEKDTFYMTKGLRTLKFPATLKI